jgi:hypothetical protein
MHVNGLNCYWMKFNEADFGPLLKECQERSLMRLLETDLFESYVPPKSSLCRSKGRQDFNRIDHLSLRGDNRATA